MYRSTKVFFSICVLIGMVSSSAIPMWEYLTQDEKVMYLFNMFQLQVQDFCKTDVCKQDLKNYGWKKLKGMREDDLDEMDPFQRNSNDIIWQSVMEGHGLMKPTAKPTVIPRANSFEDYLETADTKGEASAKIETVQKVPPSRQVIVGSGSPEYSYSSNGLQESTTENLPAYDSYGPYKRIPLQGPSVVKVNPDGSPVRDPAETVPEDDDLRLYQMTKFVLQNL